MLIKLLYKVSFFPTNVNPISAEPRYYMTVPWSEGPRAVSVTEIPDLVFVLLALLAILVVLQSRPVVALYPGIRSCRAVQLLVKKGILSCITLYTV